MLASNSFILASECFILASTCFILASACVIIASKIKMLAHLIYDSALAFLHPRNVFLWIFPGLIALILCEQICDKPAFYSFGPKLGWLLASAAFVGVARFMWRNDCLSGSGACWPRGVSEDVANGPWQGPAGRCQPQRGTCRLKYNPLSWGVWNLFSQSL